MQEQAPLVCIITVYQDAAVGTGISFDLYAMMSSGTICHFTSKIPARDAFIYLSTPDQPRDSGSGLVCSRQHPFMHEPLFPITYSLTLLNQGKATVSEQNIPQLLPGVLNH